MTKTPSRVVFIKRRDFVDFGRFFTCHPLSVHSPSHTTRFACVADWTAVLWSSAVYFGYFSCTVVLVEWAGSVM